MDNTENVMNFDECMKYLDLSKGYLYKLTRDNRIPFFKPLGGKLYFYKSEIDKWIKSNGTYKSVNENNNNIKGV
jgi:excisionase family DNA binding protein